MFIICPVSNSLPMSLRKFHPFSQIFFGLGHPIKNLFIGKLGLSLFIKKMMGDWALRICNSLNKLFYLNKVGIRWKIGTGEQISIWNDFWLPSPLPTSLNSCLSDDAPISPSPSLKNAIVNKLFKLGKLEWNANLVSSLFPRDISSSILSIPLSQCGFEDRFVWGFTKNGNFSTTSAYSLLLGLKLHHNSWKFIWSLPIPQKIQIFLWQLSHECLSVGDLLASRGWRGVSVCCFFCKQHSESLVHIFLQCDFVRSVWFGADLGFYISSTPNHSIPFWLGWVHHIGILMSENLKFLY